MARGSEPDTDTDGPKVFLSYSRKDRERASTIADVLRDRHFGVFKDTDDILPTEEWKGRLEELIAEADTIVFLLSPHSAASEVCAWEVEYATALNKRIAPIVIDDVEGDKIPPLLARLNFIFCTDRDPFENAVSTLVSALTTDIEWIREHTRIAGLARRWEDAGRAPRLLLRGQDITDTEGWRDTHPADAPAVTGAQARFISESRRAAGRRQRTWIIGSVGVAAATAALAVFAYFQSVEANIQRFEAEAQRIEADAQRALAEDNAAEAERQRKEALKRLAGDRLRAGDRAGGIKALMQADPAAPQIPTLMAGMFDGTLLFPKDLPGLPLTVNGRTHISTAQGPSPALAPFPAKYWLLSGSNTLLIASSGAMRLHTSDGALAGQSNLTSAFEPCFAQLSGEGIRVFGTRVSGYSACSPQMVEVSVDKNGRFEDRTYSFCPDDYVTFDGTGGKPELASDVGGLCLEGVEGDQDLDSDAIIAGFAPDITTLNEMASLRFPMALEEYSGLWASDRPYDEEEWTAAVQAKVDALALSPDDNEKFAISNFRGAAAGGYHMPDLMSDDRMELAASLSIWGGTGGEVHTICGGPKAAALTCHEFHSFSGFDGVVADRSQPRYAIFGNNLTPESFAGDTHNLWLADRPGATPKPIAGVDLYGAITDVAFHPDGRIAALTDNALLLIDPVSGDVTALAEPDGAKALLWLISGELVALSQDAIHFSDDGQLFDRIPIDMSTPWDDEAGPANDFPQPLWLRMTAAEDVFLLGKGDVIMLFDRELRAPLSTAYPTDDPALLRDASAMRLARAENGGFTLWMNGFSTTRSGYDGADPEDRLDPDAPFR